MRILLIEDNLSYARLVRTMLSKVEDMSFEVTICDTFSEGVRYASEEPVELIFLDLNLPDSGGIETFVNLKDKVPNVPVIVLTATDDEGLGIKAVKLGAQDYLFKGDTKKNILVRSLRYALERHRMQLELQGLSLKDELTGLNNRRGFFLMVNQQLILANHMNTECMLAFLDMDHLKDINDSFGHKAGDQALIHMSRILSETFRESDIVARIGGDELSVFTIGIPRSMVSAILNRLQDNVDAFNKSKSVSYDISYSIGISYFDPNSPCTIDDLLVRADEFMYIDKNSKRSGSVLNSSR